MTSLTDRQCTKIKLGPKKKKTTTNNHKMQKCSRFQLFTASLDLKPFNKVLHTTDYNKQALHFKFLFCSLKSLVYTQNLLIRSLF